MRGILSHFLLITQHCNGALLIFLVHLLLEELRGELVAVSLQIHDIVLLLLGFLLEPIEFPLYRPQIPLGHVFFVESRVFLVYDLRFVLAQLLDFPQKLGFLLLKSLF